MLTHERVFSRALAHRDKNKIRQNTLEEYMKRTVNMERSTVGMKKRSPDGLTVARAYVASGVATPRSTG